MSGILGFSAEIYHGDLVHTEPSLSASVAHTLVTRSPRHAWTKHPRLNPAFQREEEDKFQVGTAAHAMFLEGVDNVHVVNADSWRTNAAKDEKALAYREGKTPLLIHHYEQTLQMVHAINEQLVDHNAEPPLFKSGKPEQTLIWEEDGVVCRARLDWLRDDLKAVDDLKTTKASGNPAAVERSLYALGYDLKAAFYLRGVRAVTGARPEFRWVYVECEPPYALSVISPAPDVLELGHAKVEFAINLWRDCLEKDEWPGYSREVAWVNAPDWETARWLEREAA
jgi:hypothetical protein